MDAEDDMMKDYKMEVDLIVSRLNRLCGPDIRYTPSYERPEEPKETELRKIVISRLKLMGYSIR